MQLANSGQSMEVMLRYQFNGNNEILLPKE